MLYHVERVAWSASLQELQMLPEDLRPVRREDWQKQEVQDEASPASQEFWALVRVVHVRPHWGNELEAEVGRMLLAAKAESVKEKRARRSGMRVMNDMLRRVGVGSFK